MHCWYVSHPVLFLKMLLKGQKFSFSLQPPDQMGSSQYSVRLLLIFVLGSLFEALRHKTRGSGFDSLYSPWKFSSDLFLLSAFSSPGVHSASKRNDYQESFLG